MHGRKLYCYRINTPSSVHPVCPAAPFRRSSSPGATVTTLCSSVHPSLNPRGVITWQCQPDFTWEGDWSGCTFPEDVVHVVATLAYRVAAGASEVNNSIQTIVSDVSYRVKRGKTERGVKRNTCIQQTITKQGINRTTLYCRTLRYNH